MGAVSPEKGRGSGDLRQSKALAIALSRSKGSARRPEPKRYILAVWLSLAVLLAVCFLPIVLGRQTLIPHHPGVMPQGPYGYPGKPPIPAVFDPAGVICIDMPLVKLAGECWRRGKVPLWNPYVGCGSPLLARPDAAACSPMRIPLYVSAKPCVWNWFWLARLLLAGILAYHLARAIGMAMVPGLAAGVSYMLCGYMVLSLNLHHLDVEAVLPGFLLAIYLMLKEPSRLAFIGGALAFWQMCLGNNPQPLILGLLLGLIWGLVIGRGLKRRELKARLPAVAAMLGAGAAAALFHWLPFLELIGDSWHGHGLEGTRSAAATLPLNSARWLLGPWAGEGTLPFYYAGILTSALALAGLLGAWLGRNRVSRGLATLLGGVVVVELAKVFGLPGMGLLSSLPVIQNIWTVKYVAPLFLSLALLAGMGVESIASRIAFAKGRIIIAMALLLLVWGELCMLRPGPHPVPHDPFKPAPYIGWLKAHLADEPGARICGIGTTLIPNLAAAFRLPDVRLESSIMPMAQRRLLHDGLAKAQARDLATFVLLDRLTEERLRLLDWLRVRYLLAPRDWDPPQKSAGKFHLAYNDEVRIYRMAAEGHFAGFAPRGKGAFGLGLLLGSILVPVFGYWGLVRIRQGR